MRNSSIAANSPDSTYMSKAMLSHFKEKLDVMLSESKSILSENVTNDDSEKLADVIDIASMQEAATLNMRRRERESILAKKIVKAMGKIQSDEYGYCAECGGEIGVDRLEARPTADLCIACKENEEIKAHSYIKRRMA